MLRGCFFVVVAVVDIVVVVLIVFVAVHIGLVIVNKSLIDSSWEYCCCC